MADIPTRKKNRNQFEALALAVATGSSIVAWARANNVAPTTCYHWAATSEFKALVEHRRNQMIDAAVGRLSAACSQAADQIIRLSSEGESEQVRLNAARSVLSTLIEVTNFAKVVQDLEELRKEVETLKGASHAKGHLSIIG